MSGPHRCPRCRNGNIPDRIALGHCTYPGHAHIVCAYCSVGLTRRVLDRLVGAPLVVIGLLRKEKS